MSERIKRPASHIVAIVIFGLIPGSVAIQMIVPTLNSIPPESLSVFIVIGIFIPGLYGVVRVCSWSRWYCSTIIVLLIIFSISAILLNDQPGMQATNRLMCTFDCLLVWWLYSFFFGKASVNYFRLKMNNKNNQSVASKTDDTPITEHQLVQEKPKTKWFKLFRKQSQMKTPLLVKIGVVIGIWYLGSRVLKQLLEAPLIGFDFSWSNLIVLNSLLVQVFALVAVWNLRKWAVFATVIFGVFSVDNYFALATITERDPPSVNLLVFLLIFRLILVVPALIYWKKFTN